MDEITLAGYLQDGVLLVFHHGRRGMDHVPEYGKRRGSDKLCHQVLSPWAEPGGLNNSC